ncbi:MAG TPA: NAD-dependent epimerase/dehydratase family protein [Acetobacteraceae bacterium]|nr:NAD-dependent epimerase/dehydratase family protein [Acetobacteraceae bacterium]
MERTRTALVLGATGGIGGEAAAALLRRGWTVRALHRDPAAAARGTPWLDGVVWMRGDAIRPAEVVEAARGAALIVHAVNPPGYRRWGELVLPMLESSIAAARASGARILLPGTVYNYGPDTFPVLTEGSPQNPRTRKGTIRAEMERRLRMAAETAGVRTLIVRAGDFFGPRAGNSWFSQGLVRPGRPLRSITYPGRAGVGHAWAYLPDVAEAMACLVEEAALGAFESFHFAGHWDADGTTMVSAIRRAVGDPGLRVRRFPWEMVAAASPFVPLFRELWELRHLWREPLRLDNARLANALGAEPHTPIEVAVRDTLAGLGCLGGPAGQAPSGRPSRPVLAA